MSADNPNVLLERRDGVGIITLNRPDALNAFVKELCLELIDAVEEMTADDSVGAVVITGAGRGFSSGADLKAGMADGQSLQDRLNTEFRPSIEGLMGMPKPVIAAVNGPAAGIGCAYVLASDLVVMGENAFMMQPFINISLVPDGGITWHLAQQIGHQRAFEFIVSGDRVSASKLENWGLVNRIVPDDSVLESAVSWASELVRKAPLGIKYSKQCLRENVMRDFRSAFELEGELQEICGASNDFKEGVAAFVEKRQAKFSGS